ncbi:39S ribosomal protein L33, mitochondrial-like [Agrilus planipennis]|uniref:Large ribosomal subunit protein bL33m n=1 Tax=Agrilus planipennis TaxID=224129 RepID=A0A1W4WEZ6_AGRPL|nr:39S ribosomal protein L33, mitochondrial [Agrilus planipennis]XP_025829671.1 39S ribosomal protein L33, mitochondrial-like [Agrilus planipennis]XP_025829676.1 39S ribosomal protein L33, mitochondrial-like [Agrilus planipennis]
MIYMSFNRHSINITFEKEISRLFYDNTMFLTNILLKRVKSKRIMVQMESVVSGHRYIAIRDRLAEKLEVIKFDPFLQTESLYREKKKIRSMK